MTAVRSDSGIYFTHHGYMVMTMAYDYQRNILYAGDNSSPLGGVLRSLDGGRQWELVAGFEAAGFIPAFLLVVQENGWLLGGSISPGNIWRSKDFGESWEALGAGILAETRISLIAQVPGSHTLYAAGRQGSVFKSYDLGNNWISISTALTDSGRFEGGLLVSSLDTNYVFIGSIDGGAKERLGGVYLSKNGGNDWHIYYLGFPESAPLQWNVSALAQSPSPYYIYSTILFPAKAIYRLSQELLVTSVQSNPSRSQTLVYVLEQNYPNPFNSQTRIDFSIAKASAIHLDVYNTNGEHIANLLTGSQRAGFHSVVWDGKNQKGGEVNSGIYIYSLKAGNEILTRKLLIIR